MYKTLKETWDEFNRHDGVMVAGSMAFFGVLALAPILVIALSVAGFFLQSEAAAVQVYGLMEQTLGSQAADLMERVVRDMRDPGRSTVAALAGVSVLVYSAGRLFYMVQQALNRLWDVHPQPGQTLVKKLKVTLKRRVVGFFMVLMLGGVLIALVVGGTALGFVLDRALRPLAGQGLPVHGVVWVGQSLLVFLALAAVIGAVFALLPDVRIAWRDVGTGAVVTAVGVGVSVLLFSAYLRSASPGSVYGAAGSLVVLLLFLYWVSLVFLLGAQLTAVLAHRVGKGGEAYPGAEVEARVRKWPRRRRSAPGEAASSA